MIIGNLAGGDNIDALASRIVGPTVVDSHDMVLSSFPLFRLMYIFPNVYVTMMGPFESSHLAHCGAERGRNHDKCELDIAIEFNAHITLAGPLSEQLNVNSTSQFIHTVNLATSLSPTVSLSQICFQPSYSGPYLDTISKLEVSRSRVKITEKRNQIEHYSAYNLRSWKKSMCRCGIRRRQRG